MSSSLPSTYEQARLATLSRYDRLDQPPEEAFERLTRLAAQVFGVSTALITLIDDQRQWFKACYGLPVQELARDLSFCVYTLALNSPDDVLVVPDAASDSRFKTNPLVTDAPHIRFYAGTPLRTPDGYALGTLCLLDTQPRPSLSHAEQNILRDLAATVMEIAHQRLIDEDLRHTQQYLEDQQQGVALTLSKTFTVLWNVDLRSGAVQVQANFAELGIDEALLPTSLEDIQALIHPEDYAEAQAQLDQAIQERGNYEVQARLQFPDGQLFWTRSRGSIQCDEWGQPSRLLAVTFDVSEQYRTEQALADSEALLREIIDKTQDAIHVKDIQGRYILVNPAASAVLRHSTDEIIGRTAVDFVNEAEYTRIFQTDQQVLTQSQVVTYEHSLSSGTQPRTMLVTKFPLIQGGEIRGLVSVGRDITGQKELERILREANSDLESKVQERTRSLEKINQQLQHEAFHDILTGLPNRALFMDRLTQAIERKEAAAHNNFAVLFLDLDQFKLINDTLGHAAGDELLIGIAQRLQANLAAVNTVARLGGDEFTILLEDVSSHKEIEERVKVLQQCLALPFPVAGQQLRVTVSIGITLCDQRYVQAEDALRDADIAMYRAKTEYKGRYVFFDQTMYQRQVALLNLQRDLRQALDQGEFQVYYQPILRLTDQEVVGFEALVRWQHPQHGLVSPAEFIPLAEDNGMIREIDLWVMQEACRQLRRWNAGRAFPLYLNVNLSAQHFLQLGLVRQVQWILINEAVKPEWLHLEITESLLMSRKAVTLEMLRQLRDLGIEIILDDFGTGYSSLSYLQQFPLDGLKIDRSFVAAIEQQPEVLQTIVQLGQNLNMHVVAEGIEDTAQAHQLRNMVCEFGQGYLFARPMPTLDVTAFLKDYMERPKLEI